MSGNLTCSGRTATTIQAAAVAALADFKNTYTPACKGVTNGAAVATVNLLNVQLFRKRLYDNCGRNWC